MAHELNKGVACFMVPIQVLAGSKGDNKGRWTLIGSGCLRKGVFNQRPMQLKSSKTSSASLRKLQSHMLNKITLYIIYTKHPIYPDMATLK